MKNTSSHLMTPSSHLYDLDPPPPTYRLMTPSPYLNDIDLLLPHFTLTIASYSFDLEPLLPPI